MFHHRTTQFSRLAFATAATAATAIATPGMAQEPGAQSAKQLGQIDPQPTIEDPASGQDTELDLLRNLVTQLQQREAMAQARVEALENRLSMLEHIDAVPISLDEAATMRGQYAPNRTVARPSDPAFSTFDGGSQLMEIQAQQDSSPGTATTLERKAPAPTAAEADITEQRQGRFGRSLTLDLAASYTHFDNARINLDGFLALDAIFLGNISIDRINADIFTLSPGINLGLSDRLFVDATVPFLSRTSNFQSGGAGGSASGLVETTVHGTGIGDASVGLSYRLLPESADTPDIVLNSRVKFPTGRHPFGIEFIEVEGSEGNLSIPERLSYGTGVYGASLGVSVLKTLDPMIVFGSLTYFRNFKREFDDLDETPGDQPGTANLGNAIQVGAGLAFALNDKSSVSMSYTQRIVERTKLRLESQDERLVVGSQANVALANFGATFSISSKLALVANVGIGLTDDSPDMALSLRLPYRF